MVNVLLNDVNCIAFIGYNTIILLCDMCIVYSISKVTFKGIQYRKVFKEFNIGNPLSACVRVECVA